MNTFYKAYNKVFKLIFSSRYFIKYNICNTYLYIYDKYLLELYLFCFVL